MHGSAGQDGWEWDKEREYEQRNNTVGQMCQKALPTRSLLAVVVRGEKAMLKQTIEWAGIKREITFTGIGWVKSQGRHQDYVWLDAAGNRYAVNAAGMWFML